MTEEKRQRLDDIIRLRSTETSYDINFLIQELESAWKLEHELKTEIRSFLFGFDNEIGDPAKEHLAKLLGDKK